MKANQTATCQNCGFDYQNKPYAYCPSCGQKRLSRLTIGSLFESLMSSFFSLDSRLYHTIVPFLFQPGKLAKDFIDGKRRTYMSPTQMYFFFSFIALLATTSLVGKNLDKQLSQTLSTLPEDFSGTISFDKEGIVLKEGKKKDTIPLTIEASEQLNLDEEIKKREDISSLIQAGKTNEEIYHQMIKSDKRTRIGRLMSYFQYNIERNKGKGLVLMFFSQLAVGIGIALVLFTLLLKLFYIRRKFTLAEHFVNAVYFFSFCFFLLTYVTLAVSAKWHSALVFNAFLILVTIYFYKSMRKVYGQSRRKTILKFLLFSFTTAVVIPAVVLPVLFILSLFQYN